ncbi:Cytoplasmic tRNA 2-thiolation protein 1 [Dictyocoela muelleri]|nr:Cytoplasmic tRNA 2-thiolation protein 1 [Dictyocoela muelleri]
MTCQICNQFKAIILRPKNSNKLCKNCFFKSFESEIHETIISNNLFNKGDRVAIAVSGGKDSTVLAHVLYTLNKQYDYGIELVLLSIDEGIKGYRDHSLDVVRSNRDDYGLNLSILPFKSIVGHTMDEIANKINNYNYNNNINFNNDYINKTKNDVNKTSNDFYNDINKTYTQSNEDIKSYDDNKIYFKNEKCNRADPKTIKNPEGESNFLIKKEGTSNCTYCGVFRRRALESGAKSLNCNKIATGHNADDLAETVILNLIRGDSNRFFTCVDPKNNQKITRIKPFKYVYEKEIVLYAFHKKLKYFSTECTHSHGAHRGFVRSFIKEMERIDSKIILNIIKCADLYRRDRNDVSLYKCCKCGEITSSKKLCMFCLLIDNLNKS